jgi:hypothetical protein
LPAGDKAFCSQLREISSACATASSQ